MKKNKLILPLVVLLASCGGKELDVKETVKKDEGITLRFKPEKNKEIKLNYTVEVINDSTHDQTKFSIKLINTVDEVSKEKIKLNTTYSAITLNANIKGKDYSMDAGSPVTGLSQEAELVAAPVFVFLNKTVSFEFDDRFRKIKETIQNADSIPALKEAESKVQFILRYPENPIEKGDTWTDELEMKVGGEKIKSANFTVTEINEKFAKIKIEGQLDSKGERFGHEFKMKGEFNGEVEIDLASGWQKSVELELNFVLDILGNSTPMRQKIIGSME